MLSLAIDCAVCRLPHFRGFHHCWLLLLPGTPARLGYYHMMFNNTVSEATPRLITIDFERHFTLLLPLIFTPSLSHQAAGS